MTRKPASNGFDWALWFQWIVATALGWVLGRFLFPNLTVVVTGVALGFLQWFVLKYHLRDSWRWILATALGWIVGVAISLAAIRSGLGFLSGVAVGATIGTAQWLILRREVYWAGWWIAINVIGWTTGLVLLPGDLLTGTMAGLLTGIALELLLRYPKPPQVQAESQEYR